MYVRRSMYVGENRFFDFEEFARDSRGEPFIGRANETIYMPFTRDNTEVGDERKGYQTSGFPRGS